MLVTAKNMAVIAKMKLTQMFTDERGDVNIVSIVVLIGIAVLLAVFFKKEIMGLLESLFSTITGTANNAVSDSTAATAATTGP